MTAIEWYTEYYTMNYIVVYWDYILYYTEYNFYNELYYTLLQF